MNSNSINEDDPEVLNYKDQIMDIRNRYPSRIWSNLDAVKELADLWGATGNSTDVLPHKTETVIDIGTCEGQIHFAHTSKDLWLIGISAMSAFSGHGYSPSIFDAIGYKSRHGARKAGVKKLIRFFEAVAQDRSSCNSKHNMVCANKAVSILTSELTPQLNLFG